MQINNFFPSPQKYEHHRLASPQCAQHQLLLTVRLVGSSRLRSVARDQHKNKMCLCSKKNQNKTERKHSEFILSLKGECYKTSTHFGRHEADASSLFIVRCETFWHVWYFSLPFFSSVFSFPPSLPLSFISFSAPFARQAQCDSSQSLAGPELGAPPRPPLRSESCNQIQSSSLAACWALSENRREKNNKQSKTCTEVRCKRQASLPPKRVA